MGSLLLYVFVVVRSMLGVVVAAASPDSDDENEWCWDDKYCQYKMSMWWCCCICLCCSIVLCCCRDFSGAVLHSVRRGSGFFVINKHILSRNISPGFFFPGSKLLLGSYPLMCIYLTKCESLITVLCLFQLNWQPLIFFNCDSN